MKLGLIGNPLAHSWSPEIHKFLAGVDYKLWQLDENELDEFFEAKDFDGINVTIPYKSTVIRYLDELDASAGNVGAVNCIVNSGGRLKGCNTDVTGLLRIIEHHSIDPGEGETAILGSGGASKAAAEACRIKGWRYHIVSRSPDGDEISYEELHRRADSVTLIINATPVGMHPRMDAMPVQPSDFACLEYLIDIVANPVRTSLVYETGRLGIRAYGGLEMLVAQALAADELFFGQKMDDNLTDKCIRELLKERRNIVLIGMPSSGKTTVGRLLSETLGRKLCDLDEEIIRRIGMPIADYFREYGETAFRDIESEVCRKIQWQQGLVIAAGGGTVKRSDNMRHLAHNGIIVWLDRDIRGLEPTDSRPLSSNMNDLMRLYQERKPLYEKYCDYRIDNNQEPEAAVERIVELI